MVAVLGLRTTLIVNVYTAESGLNQLHNAWSIASRFNNLFACIMYASGPLR